MNTWISRMPLAVISGLILAAVPSILAQDKSNSLPANSAPVTRATNPNPAGQSVPAETPRNATGPGDQQKTELTPWAAELNKLARAGIDEEVLLAFVDNTEGTFNLDADQISSLTASGVSSRVIAAMMDHDAQVISGERPLIATTVPQVSSALLARLTAANDASNQRAAIAPPPHASPPADSGAANAAFNPDAGLWEFAMAGSQEPTESSDSSATQAPANAYRVRQPYPEQVTPPIMFLPSPEQMPNVVVITFAH